MTRYYRCCCCCCCCCVVNCRPGDATQAHSVPQHHLRRSAPSEVDRFAPSTSGRRHQLSQHGHHSTARSYTASLRHLTATQRRGSDLYRSFKCTVKLSGPRNICVLLLSLVSYMHLYLAIVCFRSNCTLLARISPPNRPNTFR